MIRCCGSIISASRRAILKNAASNLSIASSTGAALTKSGRSSHAGSAPAANSSSSEKRVIDSTPPAMFDQKRSIELAPGIRTAMPMMAIELARGASGIVL